MFAEEDVAIHLTTVSFSWIAKGLREFSIDITCLLMSSLVFTRVLSSLYCSLIWAVQILRLLRFGKIDRRTS